MAKFKLRGDSKDLYIVWMGDSGHWVICDKHGYYDRCLTYREAAANYPKARLGYCGDLPESYDGEGSVVIWLIKNSSGEGHWVLCNEGGPFGGYATYREAVMNYPRARLVIPYLT